MAVPAMCLVQTTADHVDDGQVFLIGSEWWLRVTAVRGASRRAAGLQLTGNSAGRLLPTGQVACISLMEGVGWRAMVASAEEAGPVGDVTASLCLSPIGPTIWGAFAVGQEHCFTLNGADITTTQHANYESQFRLPAWTAELIVPEGLGGGLTPLFRVDRRG